MGQFEMISPHVLAPFPHLLSPSLMCFRATRCIYVYFETRALSSVHGGTLSMSIAEHQFLPLVSSYLFCFFWFPTPKVSLSVLGRIPES